MEFVVGVLGSVTGGGAAAAAPAAAAAGSAAGGAATAFSILQGGATALSVLMGIASANEQATGLELQARDAKQEELNEGVLGLQRRNSLRRELVQAVGERDVAYAAAGVDLSTGTPMQAREQVVKDAERQMTIDWGTEQSNVSRLQLRQKLLKQQAKSVRRFGLLNSVIGGLQGAADIAYRGRTY